MEYPTLRELLDHQELVWLLREPIPELVANRIRPIAEPPPSMLFAASPRGVESFYGSEPDLLEALQVARLWMSPTEDADSAQYDRFEADAAQVDAAIAKAKGGE